MSHSQYLRDLLRPLGIYDLEAPFNGGELDAQGEALDRAMAALEEIQRESSLTTAESWGLEQVARLFLRRPVATQPRPLADALAALLRIDQRHHPGLRHPRQSGGAGGRRGGGVLPRSGGRAPWLRGAEADH